MKTIKMTLAAIALTSVSFAGFAADLVGTEPAQQEAIGVVSASGSNLSSLESRLAAKADAAGAKSFRINSTTGNNRMHGTAVIYQ
ncbi:multiple stress resistance protein BhsA [Erwinia amylovora]